MKKSSWGIAKSEIIASKDAIISLYPRYNNLQKLYDHLFEEGKITCMYRTFHRHATEILKETSSPKSKLPHQTVSEILPVTTQATSPVLSSNSTKISEVKTPGMAHDPSTDHERILDLWGVKKDSASINENSTSEEDK